MLLPVNTGVSLSDNSMHRTEEQDLEEKKIREEIKSIDATLKKMKKSVSAIDIYIYIHIN